jgi:hypothetical protein
MQTTDRKENEDAPLGCAICWKSLTLKTLAAAKGLFPQAFSTEAVENCCGPTIRRFV